MHVLTPDDIEDYEEQEPIYCPHCEKRGYLVLLGPRILMNNEPRPDDYDQWLECATCGWICPLHEIPAKEEIKNAIETIETPFENKTIVQGAHKRRHKTGKKINRNINKKIKLSNDLDIQREMDQHGENNVHVVMDTNP
jgi:Fe-S-cluster-containing hydrogenase component 2